MTPAGFIGTFISLKDWRQWWFNIPLLVGQLFFLIVGTVYGKIKWEKWWRWPNGITDAIIMAGLLVFLWITPDWCNIPIRIIAVFLMVAIIRGIDWRRVWQAAKCSHVRLCLGDVSSLTTSSAFHGTVKTEMWEYINFGYPSAEIEQYWRPDLIDGKRFKYFEPTFEPSDEFVAAMIEYAEGEVGKRYDWLQLILGYPANFIVWIFCPWKWGKEVIPWFNLSGGNEVCSSGWLACLRWAEARRMLIDRFFPRYDTAVVPPCLAPLSENWREVPDV